ncbi:hypothetical protein CBL_11970 [Carabus blaptoides fortunei]
MDRKSGAARETHKQLVTIYNPYDFAVRFQVLCTSPHKYTVNDPDGSIRPLCCVDIVIRHTMPIAANCNVTDRFRITMLDHSTKQVLGRRDVTARLNQGEPDNISQEGSDFQPMQAISGQKVDPKSVHYTIPNMPRSNQSNYIAIITGVICIFALFMPTKHELPEPTSLVSMVVFKP